MKKVLLSTILAVAISSVFAADQTKYDLIRPVYPMAWDVSDPVEGGTVLGFSKFTKGTNKDIRKALPEVGAKPEEFKANGIISDTLEQAYIDALSMSVSNIRVNQAGYLLNDPEQLFYYTTDSETCAETYSVVDLDGKVIAKDGSLTSSEYNFSYERHIEAYENSATVRYTASQSIDAKKVCVGKLTDMAGLPTNQRLRIKVGKEYSATFIISEDVYSMVRDAGLKYFGAQRSGNSESWFHGPSHVKDGEGALQGGWYEAGNNLKFAVPMSYAFMALSAMAATMPERDADHYAYNHNEVEKTDGIPDVLREAKHGADFFLRSFAHAKGIVDDMVVTIGDHYIDFNHWNRVDSMEVEGNEIERPLVLGNLGSNVSSDIAAGLALLSKTYAKYDEKFADSCLMVAKKMYDFARALKLEQDSYDDGKKFVNNEKAEGWCNDLYACDTKANDRLAMAAVALLYASNEKGEKSQYLNDLLLDKEINDNSSNALLMEAFEGGWFGKHEGFNAGGWTNDYQDQYPFSLYSFYKLILADEKTCETYGISKEDRAIYIEKILLNVITQIENNNFSAENNVQKQNIGSYTYGSSTKSISVNYNGLSYAVWEYFSQSYYDLGAQFELLIFAEITKDITEKKIELPHVLNPQWNYKAAKQIVINRMNYLLGMNPWDMSYVVGIGDKNESHVSHRTSNPEFYNKYDANATIMNLVAEYRYRPLVGSLVEKIDKDIWKSDVLKFSDASLVGNTMLQTVLMFLANKNTSVNPEESTKIKTQRLLNQQDLNVVRNGSSLDVYYTLNQPGRTEIQLVSVKGSVVGKYIEVNGSGSHMARFDLSNVPAGVYMVKVNTGSLHESKRIMLTK